MTVEEELIRLIDECPIGHDGRGNLVRTRAATDAGVHARHQGGPVVTRRAGQRVSYRLGGIVGGKLYIYTELPEHKLLEDALAHQATRAGRSACDVIVEDIPCVTAGVHWGTRQVLRSAIDGAVLP